MASRNVTMSRCSFENKIAEALAKQEAIYSTRKTQEVGCHSVGLGYPDSAA